MNYWEVFHIERSVFL